MAIKSLLTASVLGVIGAAVSATAFADNMVNASTFCKPGFYAGVQGGRSDTFYHPNSALGTQVFNDNSGVAISTSTVDGVPQAPTYSTVENTVTGADTDDIGLGGRLYAGYQFNPYFALETGYTQYAKTSSHATVTSTGFSGLPTSPSNFDTLVQTTKYHGEISEHAIDLVAKGTLPLQMGFGLYAKAGLAYIQADNHINATVVSAGSTTTIDGSTTVSTTSSLANNNTLYTKTYQGFRPVAGVGVNYTIPNTNMSVTADYTRVFSYGGIKNASLASLGLEYKFA